MDLKGVFWRFAVAYVGLTILASIVIRLLGLSSNSGFTVAVLIGSVMWPCLEFGKRNKRYFTAQEKNVVVASFAAFNIALQGLVGIAVIPSSQMENLSIFLAIFLIFGLIHAAIIYFFVGLVKKQLVKQGVIAGE